MATINCQSVILSLFLVALAFALTNATEKKVDIVVEGKVYCQSCKLFGTWSLTYAKPVASAIVSVTCKDYKNRVSYYKAFSTDGSGYFYAELEGFEMGGHYLLEHPLSSCKVKLVSSPSKECNLLSNVNYGINGATLRYEEKRLEGSDYEAVVYAAGPFAFRPADCPPEHNY